jgi:hypothetical protein
VLKRSYLLLILLLLLKDSYAQEKKSVRSLTIRGIILDSVKSTPIEAATIILYNTSDTNYINYQISDKYGEFVLSGIPEGTGYWLLVTYVGYADKKNTSKLTQSSMKS